MRCINCQTETTNPKFCSRSCAAIYNNTNYPKRKKEHVCKNCGKLINRHKRYCSEDCKLEKLGHLDWNTTTIKDVIDRAKYQKTAQIRDHARAVVKKSNLFKECAICKYTAHVEVCHKKPISSFDENTPINVVNHLSNLVYLCPNHHWEFDNGILFLE